MKLTSLFCIVTLLFSSTEIVGLSLFSDRGTTVMPGYGLTPSAIVLGRGGSGVAVAEDGAYSHINPAGIFNTDGDRIYMSHANLFEDSRSECLNATLLYEIFPIGVTLYYRHLGEAPVVTDGSDYDVNNTYAAYDASASFASGLKTKKMNIGFSLRLMRQEVWNYSTTAVAADGGVILNLPMKGMSAGASVINLGYASAFDKTAYPLTTIMRAGTAYNSTLKNGTNLKLLTDVQASSDGTLSIPVGLEAGNRWLTVRSGWNILHDTQSFSAGLSIKLSSIQLDYAYVHFTENLSDNSQPQFFSLSFFLN